MPESRGRRGRKPTRSKAPRPPRRSGPPSGESSLLDHVRSAMADPDPLNLLSYVSMLMYMTDPRRDDPFAGPQEQTSIRREELLPTFLDVPCPETSALLAVLAEMIGDDDVLCARIRRELAARSRLQPSWLTDLSATRISRALLMGHILGDGDNIILGVDLPGGRSGTITVYVDHNLGTLVKDALTISESFDTVVAKYQEVNDDPDTTFTDLDLADARARIEAAIDRAAMTYPPFATDSWPACRALVEWLIRRLPAGGSGWSTPQWESDSVDELADRFFRSDAGSRLDDSDRRAMLESLLWFATDYSTGDPMRWSPVKVELLLMDWLPRKMVAAADYLDLAPELLRAFITFVHGEAGVRADLTANTLAAVDHYEPQYRSVIRTSRPQGADAVLAALGLDYDDESDRSIADIMLEHLDNEVGGRAALDGLDDRPLPDEPFRWDRIDPDVAERVREVLTLIDRCCDDLLDTEYRTACRRLLARLAAPPEAFRRKGKPETAAAAVVWLVGKANDLFRNGSLQVNELMSYFGLKGSVSQRAEMLMRTAGLPYSSYSPGFGSPDFLVSGKRRWIIEQRDRYLSWNGS